MREAEDFLHSRIPLTQAMGLRVLPSEEEGFTVEAPVALNSNHLQTAFGGSINAVATLAAYGFLWLELRGTAADVVIRESTIRFRAPIRDQIRAFCPRPTPAVLAAFLDTLQTTGKARLQLAVQVVEDRHVAAEFKATFVARQPVPAAEPRDH